MSIIIYSKKENVLASDSQMTSCGFTQHTTKIKKINNKIVAGTGDVCLMVELFKWFEDGCNVNKWPQGQSRENYACLVVADSEGCYFYDYTPYPIEVIEPFHAFGSGCEIATGAMEMGATVKEAMQATIKRNAFCSGEIVTYDLSVCRNHVDIKINITSPTTKEILESLELSPDVLRHNEILDSLECVECDGENYIYKSETELPELKIKKETDYVHNPTFCKCGEMWEHPCKCPENILERFIEQHGKKKFTHNDLCKWVQSEFKDCNDLQLKAIVHTIVNIGGVEYLGNSIYKTPYEFDVENPTKINAEKIEHLKRSVDEYARKGFILSSANLKTIKDLITYHGN